MGIELSTITFTDQDDIFPLSGVKRILNTGVTNTLAGNDTIIGTGDEYKYLYPGGVGILNSGTLNTAEGNDIITSTGVIYNNGGVINTGNGNDSIIVDVPGTGYDIYNDGAINTGNGNDSIIANGGFESGLNNSGSVFLGDGEDYLNSFGGGDFYGGNDEDTLELTSGTYTVGIWGTSATFTKGNQLMITSEFEKLKAGSIIYHFTSLTAGQTIIVA